MTKTIPLPTASYQLGDLRASCKRLIGCYPELLDSDTQDDLREKDPPEPLALRRWPGITTITGTSNSGDQVRGLWEMAGVQYAVIGSSLYSIAANGVLTLLNNGGSAIPIPGQGFVRMTDNGACLVILVPNTTSAFTYTPNGLGFQQLIAPFFVGFGAADCWFVDTYIVFLAAGAGNATTNGLGSLTFFNDDGRQVSGNNQITFASAASFTRSFGTDPFVGMCVDHREVLMFGSRTSEGFVTAPVQTGTPFISAPDTFIPIGVHISAPYSIALQDNAAIFVANDLTIRRRQGQTPVRISQPGIELILREAQKLGQLQGCFALTPTIDGHPFYILNIPNAQRSLAYDCVTQKWFEIESSGFGLWRALCWYNGFGKQLIGDASSGTVGFLDPDVQTEFAGLANSTQVICAWTCQPIYDRNNRYTIRRVEAVVTAGAGQSQTVAPIIDLLESDDWGQTFVTVGDLQTLGLQSDTDNRAIWWNRGQSRSRVMQCRVTDVTPVFSIDMQAEVDGGKW
jgi:hypothetical protein